MLQSTAAAFGVRLVIHPLLLLAAFVAAHAVMIGRFEDGDWSRVGLHRAAAHPRRWIEPAIVAIAAVGLPSAALMSIGHLQVIEASPGSSLSEAARLGWLLIPAAFGEELVIRGYFFALMREAFGWKAAIVVTSVGFGLLHAANPGANAQAILTVVLAGFFLGLVLVRTGSLYAAWAAHSAWNLTLAVALHADVSGIGVGATPDYRLVDSGPDWLTGGVWGPEGGAAAAVGLLLASVIMLRPLIRERGRALA
jgi:membrane protease YdiL (CAAX protease family)